MTNAEFVEKTKTMLRHIIEGYSAHWRNKFSEEDDPNNVCQRCGGGTQIVQGGDVVDCTSCNGTGLSSERIFDVEGFADFMEHEVFFGDQPFVELMECKIIE